MCWQARTGQPLFSGGRRRRELARGRQRTGELVAAALPARHLEQRPHLKFIRRRLRFLWRRGSGSRTSQIDSASSSISGGVEMVLRAFCLNLVLARRSLSERSLKQCRKFSCCCCLSNGGSGLSDCLPDCVCGFMARPRQNTSSSRSERAARRRRDGVNELLAHIARAHPLRGGRLTSAS